MARSAQLGGPVGCPSTLGRWAGALGRWTGARPIKPHAGFLVCAAKKSQAIAMGDEVLNVVFSPDGNFIISSDKVRLASS